MREKLQQPDLDFLFETCLALDDLDECYRFFEDLCTVPELRAMSQRLHVAKMLSENCAYNDITAKTGASTATISRISRCLHYGSDGYVMALNKMKRKNDE